MRVRIGKLARRFWQSRDGAVAIYAALALVVMLGMVGSAIEIGLAYYKRQVQQTVADAAAFGGALALSNHASLAAIEIEAKAIAGAAGYEDGSNNVTVAVYCPRGTTPCDTTAQEVQVVVTQPQTLPLVGLIGAVYGGDSNLGTFTISASAVASVGAANICALALNTSGPAFQLNGSVEVGNPSCGIADNSASNPSTDIKGGAAIIHGQFSSQGPQNTAGNNASFPDARPKTGVTTPDPYVANGQNAWVMAQDTPLKAPTCIGKIGLSPNCSSACQPGTYCNVSGRATLSNGIYYVNSLSGDVTVTNATVVLYGSANFGGNSIVTITAPTSNTGAALNKGLGLVSPRAIPVSFGGTSVLDLRGAIYLPVQGSSVTLSGNVTSPCAQVIAGQLSFNGNDTFGNDGTCGVTPITTPGSTRLVQ